MGYNEFVIKGIKDENNNFFTSSEFIGILKDNRDMMKELSDTLYQMFDDFHKKGYETPFEALCMKNCDVFRYNSDNIQESVLLMNYVKRGNFIELSNIVSGKQSVLSLRFDLPEEDCKILSGILDSKRFIDLKFDFADNKQVSKFINRNREVKMNFTFNPPKKHIIQTDSTWSCRRKILQPDGKYKIYQRDFDSFDEAVADIQNKFKEDSKYLRFMTEKERVKIESDFKNSFGNGKFPKYTIKGEYRKNIDEVVIFGFEAEVSKCKMKVRDKFDEQKYLGR